MKMKICASDQRGEIMLESLIVYSVTILLLFFILAIFSVLYQRWNIQTIANETATRIAQTYRFSTADESSGYVSQGTLTGVGPYRYFTNAVTNTMESDAKTRMTSYAKWRMTNTTFAKNVKEPTYDVKVVGDGLGRRHIELTITGEYAVPFGSVLGVFGFDETTVYETKAYAECVDIIDYVNFIDYVKTQTDLSRFGSKTLKLVDSVLSLFDNIFGEK